MTFEEAKKVLLRKRDKIAMSNRNMDFPVLARCGAAVYSALTNVSDPVRCYTQSTKGFPIKMELMVAGIPCILSPDIEEESVQLVKDVRFCK